MTSLDILERALVALEENQPLLAWCQEHYRRAPTVDFDPDDDAPKDPDTYPLIEIRELAHESENASNTTQMLGWVVGMAIRDDGVGAFAGRERPVGKIRIRQLRLLVEAALKSAALGKVETGGTVETENLHPLYAAATTVQITFK